MARKTQKEAITTPKPKKHYIIARFLNKNTRRDETLHFGSAYHLKLFIASFCQEYGDYVYLNKYKS